MREGRDAWVAIPVVLGVFGFMVWSGRNEPWPTMRVAGLCLIAIGFLLWSLARIQLGKSFSIGAKATALVTHGFYSRLRNPIYIFGSLTIAGVCLYFQRPIYLLTFLVIFPLQFVRARTEAEVLGAAFGETYREYRRKTWF